VFMLEIEQRIGDAQRISGARSSELRVVIA
jgi:hypothetical protein